jgi:hypothetical protein
MFAKLAAIAEAETERLRRWVYVIHALFERHLSEELNSSQGLPVVGPEELGSLISEGLSLEENPKRVYAQPTEKELLRFVKFMDKDADGLIDEQELICFCVKGLRQTPEANLAFASRSPMHAKLIGFLEAVNAFSGADAFTSRVKISDENQSSQAAADLDSYKSTITQDAQIETLEANKKEKPLKAAVIAETSTGNTSESIAETSTGNTSESISESISESTSDSTSETNSETTLAKKVEMDIEKNIKTSDEASMKESVEAGDVT